MSKRLIVHIGANKTGSSAIQKFLGLNSALLREQGFVVPDSNFGVVDVVDGAHVFAVESLMKKPHGDLLLQSSIEAIYAAASDASTIVLSAENLAANPKAPMLFKGLVEKFDVRVILYIRRQDEYLLSAWQQWYSKISADFWAWALSVTGSMANWKTYLENWEAVVPRANIEVCVFEREKLYGNDAVADFHKRLALDLPLEAFGRPNHTINPSYSDVVMELVKGNPLIFKDVHDNDFYHLVQSVTGDRYVKDKSESSLTFAQRKAIIGRYDFSNQWVKENYFPTLDGSLFKVPIEKDYSYCSSEGLVERKLEFLTTLLYGLHGQRLR